VPSSGGKVLEAGESVTFAEFDAHFADIKAKLVSQRSTRVPRVGLLPSIGPNMVGLASCSARRSYRRSRLTVPPPWLSLLSYYESKACQDRR
jgi:hypothetical protein